MLAYYSLDQYLACDTSFTVAYNRVQYAYSSRKSIRKQQAYKGVETGVFFVYKYVKIIIYGLRVSIKNRFEIGPELLRQETISFEVQSNQVSDIGNHENRSINVKGNCCISSKDLCNFYHLFLVCDWFSKIIICSRHNRSLNILNGGHFETV